MSVAAPQPKDNQGAPAPRIEARLKVTGEARYAADTPLNNLAYAVMVTSDIARGEVKAIHLEAAKAVPGVLDILSYGDMDGIRKPTFGGGSNTSLAPLHERKIRHDGQIMALVVANTEEAAQEAAGKVTADYEIETASAGFDSAGTETLPAKGNTQKVKEDPAVGDFAAAFAAAPVKIEARYSTPTQHHNPIELFSTTAEWTGDGRLTVYEPTQSIYGFRGELARQLGMEPASVRIVSEFVGGGFGSKGQMTPRTAIVALAARRLKRPVRCVATRSQAFTTQTYRAPTRQRIQIGAGQDGKIAAFNHEGWELTSRIDNYVVAGTETTTKMYDFGAVASRVSIVKADRQTPGFMRSPPDLPYMFALESAMDELAETLGIDPVELRRINDTRKDPVSGKPYSSRSVTECFEAASKAFSWSSRNPKPGSMREDDWLVGMGCAMACYPTNVAAAAARVRLTSAGKVLVQTASHEIGTGIRTVAGQMAASELGVPLDGVEVQTGDSDLPPAPVSGGSNSTASVCSVVLKACRQIKAKLAHAATTSNSGPLAGRSPDDLALKQGALVAPDGSAQTLKDVFAALGASVIEEYAEFIPDGAPADAVQKLYGGATTMMGGAGKRSKIMFSFGAEFVEVRINARTREIRVPRLVGAFAAGRIMNTRTARSQLMGGMIWGVSSALHEETEVDPRNARYVNRDLQDYIVPVNADIQQLEVILLSETDHDVNPAGVKGLGELGNVGTNAAVANAIYHATGTRIRDLPARLDDLIAV